MPEFTDFKDYKEKLWEVAKYLKIKQDETKVKLLWGTTNLFSDKRYMNGAGTSSDYSSFVWAAASLKNMLEVTY